MTISDSTKQTLINLWAYEQRRPGIVIEGTRALNRLIPTALSHTAQGQIIGRFLLGLYDGAEHRFELPYLHHLGLRRFEDCLRVLNMDYMPEVEVHERVEGGAGIWHQLINQWGTVHPHKHVPHSHGLSALTRKRYRQAVEVDGLKAFGRLMKTAESDTGQSRTIGQFLMSLANIHNRINLTDLRLLDVPVYEDCISVLRLGYLTKTEGHHPVIVPQLSAQSTELESEVTRP